MFKTIFKKKIKVTVNRQSVLLQNKFYSYFLNAQTDVVYCSTIKSKNNYQYMNSFFHLAIYNVHAYSYYIIWECDSLSKNLPFYHYQRKKQTRC